MAQSIRLLLAQAGVDFTDKLYHCGPPPTFDRSEWLNEKFTLGLDFPNLPYLIDGDVKLTQSLVIMRYLARKYNLDAKTEADKLRVDTAEQQVHDYRYAFAMMCYRPDFEELKVDHVKTLPDKLKSLSAFLGDRPFLAGDYVTYVDFILYEFLDQQLLFQSTSLDAFDSLKSYHARVKALPNVAKYLATDKSATFAVNGAPAAWGGPYSKKD